MMATPCLAQKIAPFSGLRVHGSQAVRVPQMGENAWHFFIKRGDQGLATSDQEARTVTREKRERRVVPTARPLTANPRAQAESLRHAG
jgi:hypothetical protein